MTKEEKIERTEWVHRIQSELGTEAIASALTVFGCRSLYDAYDRQLIKVVEDEARAVQELLK